MYIWRGKNRRDKRNLLLGGERFWGAEKGAKNFEHEDSVLRLEKENEHVQYYGKKIKALMIQYLSTEKGMNEVELILKELEKTEHFAKMLSLKDNNEHNERIKANVFDLYQSFCLPETTYIDKDGLAELFRDIQMTMSKSHFEKYLTKLNLKQKGSTVDFDGFYQVLLEDLNESSKSRSSFFFRKKTTEETETEKNSSLAYKMQHRLQQNEAKLILIDHAVYHIELEARQEYRIVHPSIYICEQCNEAFIDASTLRLHSKDISLHRELIRKKLLLDEKFQCVDTIFQGNQGRHLRAHRLIHSGELGSLRVRIDIAVEDPYRPNIADIQGKRYAQQMNGSMVTGYDPKAGIRPNHKRYGLIKQHQAPIRQKTNVNSLYQVNQPQLQEVLHHLQRCKDNFIDTVSTCDNPMNTHNQQQQQQQLVIQNNIENEPLTDRDITNHTTKQGRGSGGAVEVGDGEEVFARTNNDHGMCAIVRFQWNSFVNNQVYIIGEFTGWKKEEMVCSARTNKFTIYKQLSPGRYRYRFVIDGIECVDEVASQVPDDRGPGGVTNEILVTNTPLYHTHLSQQQQTMGRTGVASPMQTATQQHALDKLGLVPSASGKFSASGKGTSTRLTTTSQSNKGSALTLPMLPSSTMHTAAALAVNTTEEQEEESEFENRSVGAIVHISQTDREGLIRHLKHIELRNLSLYDDGAWALASYINRNSFIQMIDLSYNNISDDGIQGFCGCLPLLDALHTLKLNGNGFGVDACRYLIDNLESSTTLTTLELANNRIGDDGTEVLSRFLRHNEYLQTLYLDTCLVGDDGIDCLQEALLYNRRLSKLSLMCNRFTVKSMMKLGRALQFNASLETLVLSHNPIGPEAVNCIGSSLLVNDTLKVLELADVALLAQHSSFGLHGVCAGIKTNKSLTKLDLRNNSLTDHHVIDIAHVLMLNTTLTDLDLSGNTITKIWFTDYTYIPTHILPEMPSIETLRHRNRITARGRMNTYDASKSRYIDDVQKGKWTFRRQWKRELQSQHEKAAIESEYDHEQMRINTEIEYIRINLTDIMITVKEYLEQEPCKEYISVLSKAIKSFLCDLPKFDSKLYNRYNMSVTDISVLKGKNNIRAASIKLKRSNTMTNLNTTTTAIATTPTITTNRTNIRSPSPLNFKSLFNTTTTTTPTTATPSAAVFNMDHFLNAHISITHAVFSQLNNNSPTALTLSPLLLQQAFHILTIPLPNNQVQDAVDTTIIRPINAIGIHKFSDFILKNIQYLCKENKIQRIRILSDLFFNPPILEAKTIIYNHLYHIFYQELREKYRKITENIPKYVCNECKKRFTKEKHLNKHILKGNQSKEHKLYRLKEVIQHSQVLFLQDIKHTLTNVFFPAYYELKPSYLLPKNYYPQVFDKMGSEGRPIGVVESLRTVRALDVFGEYLHINLHGELGWIRYRHGREFYLQPVCNHTQGFDWDKLHIQETTTYYRVNDALSPEVELKVRYQPLAEGEVLGYLRRNQVIECYAVIGDWLQVRYGKEDAAWVRWRTTTSTANTGSGTTDAATSSSSSSNPMSFPARMVSSIGFNPTQSLRSLSIQSLSSLNTKTKLQGDSLTTVDKIGSPNIGSPNIGSPNIGSPIARYRGTHTHAPGTAHTQEDNLYKDDLMTYEINGIKTKVHLRKNPQLSREKIDHFNRIRYGSSSDGSDTHNLLLLPSYFVSYLTPPTLPGQITQSPISPLELNQTQIFDYIMSKSIEELVFTTENSIQRERNEMFFDPLCSPISSPTASTGGGAAQRRRNRRNRISSSQNEDSLYSPSKLSSADEFTYLSDDERGIRGGIVSQEGRERGGGRGKGSGTNVWNDQAKAGEGLAGIKMNRFGVSFKDQVYTVEDEEDLVDHAVTAGTEKNNLQNYDFVKTKKH